MTDRVHRGTVYDDENVDEICCSIDDAVPFVGQLPRDLSVPRIDQAAVACRLPKGAERVSSSVFRRSSHGNEIHRALRSLLRE